MASSSKPPENRAPAWLVIGSQVMGLVIFAGAVILIAATLVGRPSGQQSGGLFSQLGSAVDPKQGYETATPGPPEPLPTEPLDLPVETALPTISSPNTPEWPKEVAPSTPTIGDNTDVIKIAIDLPVSGGDASDGIPTRNGMQLAIDQANANGGVTIGDRKYKLQMYALDDVPPGGQAHDAAQGVKNADSFISDPNVMVMLGPFNNGVAQAIMPKLNVAGLCNISPSNTNPTLTKPEYGKTETSRPTGKVTYFRIATTDDLQGPAAADYAYDRLGVKKVFILDDTETFGKMIADGFDKRFVERGGAVLGHEGVAKGTEDYSVILTKIAATNPDLLYYGGTSSNNIPLARKQLKDAGLNIPLLGGDGILDSEYTTVAGADAEGSIASEAYVNAEALPEAQQFIKDYAAAGFKEPLGDYSGLGYEAANIAIDALRRAGAKDREAVCEALRNTRGYRGITGETSFDENGDTTNRVISFYQVLGGKWQFAYQFAYTGK